MRGDTVIRKIHSIIPPHTHTKKKKINTLNYALLMKYIITQDAAYIIALHSLGQRTVRA